MGYREGARGRPNIDLAPKPRECFVSDKKIAEMAGILEVDEDELVSAINEFLPKIKKSKTEDGISYDFVYCNELSREEILQSTGVELNRRKKGLRMRLLVRSTEKPHFAIASDFFVFVVDHEDPDTKKNISKILISEKGDLGELKDLGVGVLPIEKGHTPSAFRKVLRKVRDGERRYFKKKSKKIKIYVKI